MIKNNGYLCEEHEVTTEDGYVLTLHRIPNGKRKKNNGKVLFLMHGILSSSADWIVTGETKGLGTNSQKYAGNFIVTINF